MKKIINKIKLVSLLLFCLITILTVPINNNSIITYDFSGGRFGDNLLAYCHAKWISYLTNIPLGYRSFLYSDQLCIHKNEKPLPNKQFLRQIIVKNLNDISTEDSNLYIIPYFPESSIELERSHFKNFFCVDWNNQEFINVLKENIKPINKINDINLPSDKINIAVHVRIGTGFDISSISEFENLSREQPFKTPPHTYYIEQIKKLCSIFESKHIYVYIFTDHDNPQEIAELYDKEIADPLVTFDFRKEENKHYLNVLEDFFAITKFDCLIRPDSNFSIIAEKISNFLITISPKGYKLVNHKIIINEVNMTMKRIEQLQKRP